MRVEGTFFRMKSIAQMTRAALRIWQFVIKYTTKPLLSQGVEDDMAMAKNSRRKSFAGASLPTKKNGAEMEEHIAFDDMCKLVQPDKTALYTPPTSQRIQVVALANWESAPTFVLDEHLHQGIPKASTDRLLNKCNPFLSGKRRANSEDLTSEAPTVSTDCSTIPENAVEELDIVEEEVDDIEEKEAAPIKTDICETKVEQVPTESEGAVDQSESKLAQQQTDKKKASRWVWAGHGRWVKHNAEQTPTDTSSAKAENLWTVRWVQVGYGRYTKYYVNGETREKIAA
ncbi:hypothetical protein F442_17933 [Phytophthora nicotianae P10297]|uniref:Uncharacterized protein n=4 Tax=Phytophthora nicotianae TaxID=4792 RepID=W2PLZ3_PHYN3|nr:hypothetical protein PPTG_16699 [Phytophthora nicotianae INRA-310]ETL29283.1 hypothetical protein L916_17503 [Phytophthora nicotianae]ETO64321.1 hypothetical protein F444_18114 [Phytophthora nicotianae P1976]ETP33576.1 hypothetical protein F442_17933 [Phytophthora nicotianae P10297]ETL82502.1 hypothetical protein L917_17343 [Phytophthora nicotianae]ETM35745.1 hypothetical protein L914_17405 [Phytophthora nicotianae]